MKPPKDYAKELVEKYELIIGDSHCDYIYSKECALIDVENTLKAAFYTTDLIYQYYLQVKTEIINLK